MVESRQIVRWRGQRGGGWEDMGRESSGENHLRAGKYSLAWVVQLSALHFGTVA